VCFHAIFGKLIVLLVSILLFFVDACLNIDERIGGALGSLLFLLLGTL
jgi:hypothetical protein